MNTFCLVWGSLIRSSIWVQESKETRLVWITLLVLKDSNGCVTSSLIGLADAAKVTLDECREAIRVLSSPDPNDTSKVDEGRRIREIQGGWEVVNHDMYRFSTQAKRAFWREQKAAQRSRKKNETARQLHNSSAAYEMASKNGATDAQLDAILTDHLPLKARKKSKPEGIL
jgi:hypothetical protein